MAMASSADRHRHRRTNGTVIESFGSTSLTQIGSTFYLYDSNQSGPSLKNGGAAFVAGSAGGWTPIGAEQTASGYEVAWKVTGTDQYGIWLTDSNGNFHVESRGRRLRQQHDLEVAGSQLPSGSQWRRRHYGRGAGPGQHCVWHREQRHHHKHRGQRNLLRKRREQHLRFHRKLRQGCHC